MTTTLTRPVDASPGPARLDGIDLARAAAIIGMVAVHVGPTDAPGLAGLLIALPSGRAALLFVFVAGIGVTLLGRRATRLWRVRLRLIWTAAVLLPIGLALQELHHGIWVVLHHYAALFLIGAALWRLPGRWLLGLALLMAVAGPVALVGAYTLDPTLPFRDGVSISDSPAAILRALFVTGPYPLLTWSAPFLFGMWVGRLDLHAGETRVALALGGAAVAVFAAVLAALLALSFGPATLRRIDWSDLVSDFPHSQMPLWVIGSTASAALVVGLSLIAADRWPALTLPLRQMGKMALSVYTAHLIALHWYGDVLRSDDPVRAGLSLLAIIAVAVAVSMLWLRFLPRGPLELVILAPWTFRRRRPGGG